MTPVRGLTTKWSVSCMPYFTGDPSGSWPFRTNTSVPTLVDSESGKPVGYPPASRIGGSFTLLPAGTTKKKQRNVYFLEFLLLAISITHMPARNPFLCTLAGLFIPLVNSLLLQAASARNEMSRVFQKLSSRKYREREQFLDKLNFIRIKKLNNVLKMYRKNLIHSSPLCTHLYKIFISKSNYIFVIKQVR